MKTPAPFIALLFAIATLSLAPQTAAQERTLTPEQLEALSKDGELGSTDTRPAKLPDLTKGEPAGEPGKYGQHIWPLGPTGLYGHMVGGPQGDQIEVSEIQKGSPAEGKMRWGDVILGVNGVRFTAGKNMGMLLGKQIIESERPVNEGKLKLIVWRDHNFEARNGKKNISRTDVDDLIDKAQGDNTLYDWVPEEKRAEVLRSSNFDEFPLKGEILEITLQLEVLPEYSDTSPYDCPKAQRILENGWEVLEKQFAAGKIGASRSGAIAALALVASGKPEHRELVREWVRSPKAKQWHPNIGEKFDIMKPGGYQSWRMSFDGLDCAIYYHATGDEFVLPAIKAYAVHTAKGQAGGGSWGHTFAWPSFNGGQLHGMNPGYGALNAAGNRCFMLIALAKQLGVEHPEIDQAIERSTKFFGSYYEKGAVPYGHHGAAASDDSNGKNVGVAFALKILGDDERARWFAQMSSHASFTRRGGHGSGWLWHYTPWAATMMGPKITIAAHRNLRWRYTLCRQFDGSFTCHSNYGKENLRNPTATYVMHYSAPMKQTLFSGKGADESMAWTDEEFSDLLTIAQGQFNDPTLLEQAGTPVLKRSTEEMFKFLGVFKPKARNIFARELGRRYQAGEKDILPRLAKLMESDNPRLRGAALRGLEACGPDATLQYLSGVAKLLNDKEEFVRMRAVATMSKASHTAETKTAVLQSNLDHEASETMSPNSVGSVTQSVLFNSGSALAMDPFDAGVDNQLVRDALAKLITMDPAGNRPLMGNKALSWNKQTAARLAGPLIYAAEQEQIADQMFSSRRKRTLAYLESLGYQEAIDAGASYLRRYHEIPRHVRPKVFFKRGNVETHLLLRHPGAAKHHVDDLTRWMLDKPLQLAYKGNKEDPVDIPLYVLINKLEAAGQAKQLPQIAEAADQLFSEELAQAGSDAKRAELCRTELADPAGKYFFRKLAAMRYLVKDQPSEALADLMPYLSHGHWRVQEAARQHAVRLAKTQGDAALINAFEKAEEPVAVGILSVLGQAQTGGAKRLAQQALGHAAAAVRSQAAQCLFAVQGESSITTIFEHMQQEDAKLALLGCEKALLAGIESPAIRQNVRSQAIKLLADAEPALRESLYWVISQCGGSEAMASLKQACESSDDTAFRHAVHALSFSPDPESETVLMGLIKNDKSRGNERANFVASESVRRMMISEAGLNKRPVESQLDWAEDVLDQVLDNATIAYLGRIKTGRCAFILQQAMRRGAPASAAQAIIEATNDLSKSSDKDLKLAESALVDVIEFIEVTYIRGTAEDFVRKTKDEQMRYIKWKAISAQAGKNLLKLTKFKKPDPLEEFDDLDLDL